MVGARGQLASGLTNPSCAPSPAVRRGGMRCAPALIMHTQPRLAPSAINVIGLVGLLSLFPLARAQAAETITATAHVKVPGGVEASTPVSVTIDRLSTDAERDTLLATLKKSGTAGVGSLLLPMKSIGTVRV